MTEEENPTPPPEQPQPTPTQQPLEYAKATSGVYTGPPPDKDATNMGMLAHLLGIFTVFLGPLLIWLLKKDQHPFIDHQGKEALNFQITRILASICCIVGLCIAPILILAVNVTALVFSIIATVKSSKGEAYRYPICLRLIK